MTRSKDGIVFCSRAALVNLGLNAFDDIVIDLETELRRYAN